MHDERISKYVILHLFCSSVVKITSGKTRYFPHHYHLSAHFFAEYWRMFMKYPVEKLCWIRKSKGVTVMNLDCPQED